MAEIKIEKKSPIWPWILLALALIAIVVYFVYYNDNEANSIYNDDVNSEANDTISSNSQEGYGTAAPYMGPTGIVEEFENSVTDSTRIGVDSIYTRTAIVNLAKVVTTKADELDLEPSLALENLKFYSDQSSTTTDTETPGRTDMFNNFQKVSKDIVTVLETIQTENYPSLEDDVSELKQTSSKIETNIATKEQQTTMQTFFTKAKKVVNDMNT